MKNHWLKEKLNVTLTDEEYKLMFETEGIISVWVYSWHGNQYYNSTFVFSQERNTFEEYFRAIFTSFSSLKGKPDKILFIKHIAAWDYKDICTLEKINGIWVRA